MSVPSRSLHPLNIHLFTCICPFFLCNFMQGKYGCTLTEKVVTTLRNLYLSWRCGNPSRTLHHSEGCGLCKVHKWRLYSSQANICPWKNPRNGGVQSQCTTPDKMLLFPVEIIIVASSVTALGKLKKKNKNKKTKEENPIFNLSWLAATESLASMFFLFFIINLFGKRCHACLKLQDWG